jgi:hypothetical protein
LTTLLSSLQQRARLNDVASENMDSTVVKLLVAQSLRSKLKEEALWNMKAKDVALPVDHPDIS